MEKFPKLVTDIKPQFQEAGEASAQEKCKKQINKHTQKKPKKNHFQEYHIKAAENQKKILEESQQREVRETLPMEEQ